MPGARRARAAMRLVVAIALTAYLGGCGLVSPRMTEPWDNDPDATYNMEVQVRKAIYCELRKAVVYVRGGSARNTYLGKDVTTAEDQPLPDTWGVQVTLTFQVDEKSSLNPGVSLTSPLPDAVTTFPTAKPVTSSQSFNLGLGGVLSSDATRYHKFYSFYSIAELGTIYSDDEICQKSNAELGIGPPSSSTPLLVEGNLGIYDWLRSAAFANTYLRSSRAALNGEGPALTTAGFGADTISHDIKFVIRTEGSVTPMWKLVRVTGNTTTPLLDAYRERNHEVQITIGPANLKVERGPNGRLNVSVLGPSPGAAALHQAGQIGTAVANALRQ